MAEPDLPQSKICSKCGEAKPLAAFSRSQRGKYGRRSDCKVCHAVGKSAARLANLEEHRARQRAKYRENPEKALAATARWRAENRDLLLAQGRAFREANRAILRQKDRDRIAANPDRHRERGAAYRRQHPAKVRASVKRWQKANPDKVREIERRKRSTPQGRVTNTVRAAIHRGIAKGGKNGQRTFEALGYSVADLMRHLERQFLPGMSWENFGEWHIDHRLPLAMFDYQTVDDDGFKAAWSLSNLQPLWASENHQKKARRLTLL